MEDPDMRLWVEKETRSFLKQYDDKVIIDEAQLNPKLFLYLQTHTDNVDKHGTIWMQCLSKMWVNLCIVNTNI